MAKTIVNNPVTRGEGDKEGKMKRIVVELPLSRLGVGFGSAKTTVEF